MRVRMYNKEGETRNKYVMQMWKGAKAVRWMD